MLGHLDPTGGNDHRGAGGNVIFLRPGPTSAHNVDNIGRCIDAQHLFAHLGDGTGDFVNGFAAQAKPHQQRRHLGRRGVCHSG